MSSYFPLSAGFHAPLTDYVLYVRRSSEDKKKQIRSIPDQLAWGKAIAKERGIHILRIFTDTKTARKPGREDFQEMMSFIHALGRPVGILTRKMDRLARNPIDEGTVKYAFMQRHIGHILASDREFREGESQILMGVEFGNATQFSIDLSRNVKRGMASKVKSGWHPGRAPLGYLNDPYGLKGEKKIFTDPERFPMVRRMWDLLLTGLYTVPQIWTMATEEWGLRTPKGTRIALSSMYRIFSSSFYAGLLTWGNATAEGNHPRMITMDEFDRAQLILGRPRQARPQKHVNPLAGIIACGECGYSIVAEPPKKRVSRKTGQIRIYQYYQCSKQSRTYRCGQKCIRRDDLHEQMGEMLRSVQISPAFLEWAMKQLTSDHHSDQTRAVTAKRQISQKLSETEAMLQTLDDKLLTHAMDDAAYLKNKTRLEKEKLRLKTQYSQWEDTRNSDTENFKRDISFAQAAFQAFRSGDAEVIRQTLMGIGSEFSLRDRKLTVTLKKPFKFFPKVVKREREVFRRFGKRQTRLHMLDKKDLQAVIPVWSALLGEIRKESLIIGVEKIEGAILRAIRGVSQKVSHLGCF